MQKVRSRKAPVFGKVDKVVAPKGYLANSEGGPASETLQSIRSDLLTNGQVVWVKSQQALYVYSQTGTAPAFPLGVAASPAGCWRRVAPELYQFGAGAPTVDAAYVGQEYLDTTNDVWYKAVTTGTGAGDWVLGGGTTSPLALVDRLNATVYETAWKFLGPGVTTSGGQAVIDSGYVSVKEFGAIGDYNPVTNTGSNDTAAFAAAMTYCEANKKDLYVPNGVYRIMSTVVTPPNGFRMFGDGPRSIIWGAVPATDAVIQIGNFDPPYGTAFTVAIENLALEGGPNPGKWALRAGGLTRSRVDVWAHGGFEAFLSVARTGPGTTNTITGAGSIEQSFVRIVGDNGEIMKELFPGIVQGFPDYNLYSYGWINASYVRIDQSGATVAGIYAEGSYGGAGASGISACLQGCGIGIHLKANYSTRLEDIYCENNVTNDILIENCNSIFVHGVRGKADIVNSPNVIVTGAISPRPDDTSYETAILGGGSGPTEQISKIHTVRLSVPYSYGGQPVRPAFDLKDPVNLCLNGDMARFIPAFPNRNIWNWRGYRSGYVATKCGVGLADTTRTRNARWCAKVTRQTGFGNEMTQNVSLPQYYLGAPIVFSAKVKLAGDATSAGFRLGHGADSGGIAWDLWTFGIDCENGFKFSTVLGRVSQNMITNGLVLSFTLPNNDTSQIYISECQLFVGFAGEREYIRAGESVDGAVRITPDGVLQSTTSAAPALTDPITGFSWQIGDVATNIAPSVLGAPGSQYVITGWICTQTLPSVTWTEMRTLTGT